MSTAPLPTGSTFTLDTPTILCILFALSFMPIAYFLGQSLIPSSQTRNRLLFYWHAYDALTHLFIEGSFLYECFTSYAVLPAGLSAPDPAFLGIKGKVFGAAYGSAPSSRLWQEYAKADHRWASADATVISLELLTVFLGGPAAVYVCYLLWQASLPSTLSSKSSSSVKATPSKSNSSKSSSSTSTSAAKAEAEAKGAAKAKLWLVATALATAELYGGFMTFAPEWLTGSTQLDTSNMVYTWFYLFFFNTLWVWIPLWVLYEAVKEVRRAFVLAEGIEGKEGKKSK
ncbi:Emopamil-binding protein [Aspergillus multicolor]|uniref:EXPERA domain-containing protein n=1 Tax=Aspergillus multicolor TaxID=41759 RepID=UPI003CCDB248